MLILTGGCFLYLMLKSADPFRDILKSMILDIGYIVYMRAETLKLTLVLFLA